MFFQGGDELTHLVGKLVSRALPNEAAKIHTFVTTLGRVARCNPRRVFHSVPSGTSMLRSNCALLVYGYGRSLTRYFAAFLSRFSEMMTCAFL